MPDADPAAASLGGVSESGTSEQAGGTPPPPTVRPVVVASGEHPGGSIAERVASRRRGSATTKAEAAAAPPAEGVREQVAEPPAEGLTLNFLATQLLDLQNKYIQEAPSAIMILGASRIHITCCIWAMYLKASVL